MEQPFDIWGGGDFFRKTSFFVDLHRKQNCEEKIFRLILQAFLSNNTVSCTKKYDQFMLV